MRRLADAGDRPGALAAYDRLSERLRSALGLAPSARDARAGRGGPRGAAPADHGAAPAAAAAGRPPSADGPRARRAGDRDLAAARRTLWARACAAAGAAGSR